MTDADLIAFGCSVCFLVLAGARLVIRDAHLAVSNEEQETHDRDERQPLRKPA